MHADFLKDAAWACLLHPQQAAQKSAADACLHAILNLYTNFRQQAEYVPFPTANVSGDASGPTGTLTYILLWLLDACSKKSRYRLCWLFP